jgi:hypothetical protein
MANRTCDVSGLLHEIPSHCCLPAAPAAGAGLDVHSHIASFLARDPRQSLDVAGRKVTQGFPSIDAEVRPQQPLAAGLARDHRLAPTRCVLHFPVATMEVDKTYLGDLLLTKPRREELALLALVGAGVQAYLAALVAWGRRLREQGGVVPLRLHALKLHAPGLPVGMVNDVLALCDERSLWYLSLELPVTAATDDTLQLQLQHVTELVLWIRPGASAVEEASLGVLDAAVAVRKLVLCGDGAAVDVFVAHWVRRGKPLALSCLEFRATPVRVATVRSLLRANRGGPLEYLHLPEVVTADDAVTTAAVRPRPLGGLYHILVYTSTDPGVVRDILRELDGTADHTRRVMCVVCGGSAADLARWFGGDQIRPLHLRLLFHGAGPPPVADQLPATLDQQFGGSLRLDVRHAPDATVANVQDTLRSLPDAGLDDFAVWHGVPLNEDDDGVPGAGKLHVQCNPAFNAVALRLAQDRNAVRPCRTGERYSDWEYDVRRSGGSVTVVGWPTVHRQQVAATRSLALGDL